eukprot:TRINITY_DN13092_c0_g2_i1.p1 TRINITY_DN13092_c0_g2~~TRINITY_DN13092_c0_g2_i1.p1  ORF type:complete len:278 (+),score=69.26 TRINITY_DN13092_c0_g2_i1:294-1127(+)
MPYSSSWHYWSHGSQLAAFIFMLEVPDTISYATFWDSCKAPLIGDSVMRKKVTAPVKSSYDGLLVQLDDFKDVELPGSVSELKALGKELLMEELSGKSEAIEDRSWPAAELWHRGLGEKLSQQIQDVSENMELLQNGLILWPYLRWDRNWQYILTASSGTLEPLHAGGILLTNMTGGLMDPSIAESEEDVHSEHLFGDPATPELYKKYFDMPSNQRCNGRLASTVISLPGHMLPPLRWRPPNSSDSADSVVFAMAYASGKQVRRVELQLGESAKHEL